MINNAQAMAMVNEFKAKVEQDKINKVIEFCDTKVTDKIECNAKIGITHTDIEVPQDIDFYMVLSHIQEQGLKAYETGVRKIWVQWQ